MAKIPALNVDLLSDILIWAAQDAGVLPKPIRLFDGWGTWDQGYWAKADDESEDFEDQDINVCGTAFCMAGQAAVQTGHRFEFDMSGTADYCYPVQFKGLDKDGKPTYKKVGNSTLIDEVGQKALGLLNEEADLFFDGDNDFGRVAWLATNFARARGVDLKIEPEIVAAACEYNAREIEWSDYEITEPFIETISFNDPEVRAKYIKKWTKNAPKD